MSASSSSVPEPVFEWPAVWAEIADQAPSLAGTMISYLIQLQLGERLALRSVKAAEICLRQFASHVIATDGSCQSAADVTDAHVSSWQAAMSRRVVGAGGRRVPARSTTYKLRTLRRFLEHISGWGCFDAPAPVVAPRRPGAPVRGPRPSPAKPPSRALPPETSWEEIALRAPQLAATMCAYLDQITVSHRPTSVAAYSLALRHLAAQVTATDPTCARVADISRAHIEAFKLAFAARPGLKGAISTTTIRHNLGMIRTFFERIIDWDWADAPRRAPIFAGDIPKADEPLPKFLDDPTAAKFMATLAADPDRRRRLLVELLARTGMRAGELVGIGDDAMYRVGDRWWLRIPVGKLHNDRTVPLHPLLVGLIRDYQAGRGPSRSGYLLERDSGQPFDRRTIHRYVMAVARRAGIARVHPHQLRHTLATQCLNRGMSLEAIAALLGHRSPRMTLIYARISDENVAEQYFTATRAVEAEATAAPGGRVPASGPPRRLLANGYCTRPLALDCRFQSVCEGCGFYETNVEFIDILSRQRDDATAHADAARAKLYDEVVRVIDGSA